MSADGAIHTGYEHEHDVVEVAVPLRPEFAMTVRTVAASLAADSGFTIEELDDLRLAISEVYSVIVNLGADSSRARVGFALTAGAITVSFTSDSLAGEVRFDELATNILRAVVDDYRIDRSGATLTKRSGVSAGTHSDG